MLVFLISSLSKILDCIESDSNWISLYDSNLSLDLEFIPIYRSSELVELKLQDSFLLKGLNSGSTSILGVTKELISCSDDEFHY